ncbi:la-related protein 7 [Venturia canescens]|uniref:la-related protein 7 n=1 Tax=Venturia canescens TaxID=32260 RepID=UPI001C9C1C9C|nr:la-related protein 7 [Venturia canescens]XP_043286534.1 la-related protein 7 [Venturia canescens]XP_043286535.1 la-related protein 7 [Venturia canescens]XP_043286536.1 la-related protein 7 [Venturia canescens]XP_043286537.1 la-related protein 7 [Venturia canescens]XP_043286538.1 la-related protein 7 [Venturia canescens]
MVTEEQESDLGLVSESIPVPQMHNSLQQPCQEMHNQGNNVRGKPRLRKKALHALILKQMEFYFSDANLSKDRFLGTLIKSDPYVDLDVFLRFNKIRILTDDVNRVAKAIKNSTILSLSEDGTKVCRTTPINPRENCEACTVYVQGLPPDATHEWLTSLFSKYGPIAYISIPRYKNTSKIKGFAFVEFDKVEGANECLKAFEEKHCTLPSHTAPNELLSITTFTDDNPSSEATPMEESSLENTEATISQKRKGVSEDISEEDESSSKKARIDASEGKSNKEDKQKEKDSEKSDAAQSTSCVSQDDEEKEKITEGKERKKKRKRKRRSRGEQMDAADLGLQIMAKRDWKQLRNKYLQLQRNKMKQLKQHLHKARWNQWGSSNRIEGEEVEKKSTKEKSEVSTPKFVFTPGVIVKIELEEPCSNPKNFKLELRSDTAVKYIDVHEGSSEAFVRCDTAESAKTFVEKYNEKRTLCIIDGAEEKAYWDKMSQDREEKLGKKDRVKQRGRDKLLKKAEKELGKHIKFDEV